MIENYKHASKQQGIGLIELMISMLIGLFIMAGVLQLFSTSSQNAVANAGLSRIQENLRYSFSRIAEDLGQTGNMGCISASLGANTSYYKYANPIVNMLGKQAEPGQFFGFTEVVNGADNVGTGSGTTTSSPPLDGSAKAGTDTLRIRYVNHRVKLPVVNQNVGQSITVEATTDELNSLQQDQIVAVADCTEAFIFMITGISDDVISHDTSYSSEAGQHNLPKIATEMRDFRLSGQNEIPDSATFLYAGTTGAYQYFISTSAAAGSNACSDDNPQFCALYRSVDGELVEELAEGVHDMQVEYGWTDVNGVLRTGNAGDVDTASAWNVVDRVRVTFSFNSIEFAQGAAGENDAINITAAAGNNLNEVFTKTLTRTFNLYNQI